MKNIMKIVALVVLLALPMTPVFGQTTTTQTILSTAITSTSSNALTVASASTWTASSGAAQYFMYVDREMMQVLTVNTTTGAVTVRRGANGTVATRHNLNAVVFFGQAGSRWDAATGNVTGPGPFITQPADRPVPVGPCTAASNSYLPVINVTTGDLSNCINLRSTTPGAAGTAGEWQTTNFARYSTNRGITTVDDAAYTVLLTDDLVVYSRVTATRIVTLPSISGIEGKRVTIKSMGPSTSALTVTSVNGQSIGTHNGGMTTTVNSAGGSVKLISYLQTAVGTNAYIWITEP